MPVVATVTLISLLFDSGSGKTRGSFLDPESIRTRIAKLPESERRARALALADEFAKIARAYQESVIPGLETYIEVDLKRHLSRDLEEGLYRVALEALNNVLKHAQAKRVEIKLGEEGGVVYMEIVDDGVGFNVEDLATEGGFGMHGMQERTAGFGGKLSFESRPGHGTCVRVEVDLR